MSLEVAIVLYTSLHVFSYKHAVHIMVALPSFPIVLYAILMNVCNSVYGIPSFRNNLEMEAPAPFNGFVIEQLGGGTCTTFFKFLMRCMSQDVLACTSQHMAEHYRAVATP